MIGPAIVLWAHLSRLWVLDDCMFFDGLSYAECRVKMGTPSIRPTIGLSGIGFGYDQHYGFFTLSDDYVFGDPQPPLLAEPGKWIVVRVVPREPKP